jgi:HAD superfamily hydrolase (TIGR01549 family)
MPRADLPIPRKYDAVLFDLDDTLTVTRTIKFDMHRAIARERYGRVLTDDEIRRHYDKPIEDSLRGLHGGPDTRTEELVAVLDAYQQRFPHRVQTGALTVVRTLLAAKLQVGIITGSPESVARSVLEYLGFPVAQMVGIYCYNSARLRKPSPMVFDEVKALLRARHWPHEPEILYVGDGLEDYRAAHAAGVDFVGVTTGVVTGQDFRAAGAECSVPKLIDLLKILQLG